MRPAGHPPIDGGLQGERTALAWHRTALALLVNGLLALRSGLLMEQHFVTAAAVVVIGCAALTMAYVGVRRRQLMNGRTPPLASWQSMAAIASLTALAAAVGCAAVILSWH